jgi:hypothetical protein
MVGLCLRRAKTLCVHYKNINTAAIVGALKNTTPNINTLSTGITLGADVETNFLAEKYSVKKERLPYPVLSGN